MHRRDRRHEENRGHGHERQESSGNRAYRLGRAARAEPERDRGAAADVPRDAARGAHRGESRDEGLEAPPRRREAVDRAPESAGGEDGEGCGGKAQAAVHEKPRRQRRGERQDGADREIDASRHDDGRHPHGQDPFLRHLPEDVGQVAEGQKHGPPAAHRREDDSEKENADQAEDARETGEPSGEPGARARWSRRRRRTARRSRRASPSGVRFGRAGGGGENSLLGR